MLRACVIDFKCSCDDHLSIIELAHNNNYRSSIQMDHYEALYRHIFKSPVGWFEVGETALIRSDLVHDAMELHEREAESYICKTFQDLE